MNATPESSFIQRKALTGKGKRREESLGLFRRRREAALLLLHRDLLGDAGGVLGIGFGDGPPVHRLVAQRADALADVEDVRGRGLLRPVLRSDPVDDVEARGVLRGLG